MRTSKTATLAATVAWLLFGLASFATAQPTYQLLAHFNVPEAGGATPYSRLVKAADGSLYGVTNSGGAGGFGTVFKMDAAGTFTTLHSFTSTDGAYPYSGLTLAADGNVYGTTTAGGANNAGTVFRVDATGTLTTIYTFAGSDGIAPYGALVQGTDGLLYGTTSQGGLLGYGTTFRMDTAGNFVSLHSFTSDDGANPYATLMQASDGSLYGTTSAGGSGGFGTVFSFSPGGVLITLHNFSLTDGGTPLTSVVQGTDGRFYGTTSGGGLNQLGTIFVLDLAGGFTSLHDLAATDPADSLNDLILGADGNFYVTGSQGGVTGFGAVVKVDMTGTMTLVTDLPGGPAGAAASHSVLIQDVDGSFYGTSVSGGPSDLGTIFKVDASANLSTLHTFISDTGAANPNAGLVKALDGSLYGTTANGGTAAGGTIFKLDPSGVITQVHDFAAADGTGPYAHLVQTSDGSFYGTTTSDGASGSGTIFKIDSTGALTVVHSFSDVDGTSPNAGLLFAGDGSIYGTTSFGGPDSSGTIFKIDATGTFTTLHMFNYTDGAYPYSNLVDGGDGFIYGTTTGGGPDGSGTIFKIDAAGTLTTLHNLTYADDGAYSYGGLIKARDGNFYGTNYGGGLGYGTIFKMDAAGTFTVLHMFSGTDGANPNGSLVQALDGRFYGTTSGGGAANAGTLFRIDSAGTLVTLYSFSGPDGSSPNSELMQDTDGTFYGTASEGGPGGGGVVFSLAVPNRPPTLTSPGDQANNEGDAVSLALVASDPDGDVLTYSATALPPGLTVDPVSGIISGSLSYTSAGTYSVTVSVSDGQASASQTFTWTVANVNRPPVLTDPGAQAHAEGQAISLQLVGSDPDGDALTYSVTSVPEGLALNPSSGLITGTLSFASAGSYSITATVSDGSLSASQTFTWSVANTNRAPILANPGPQTNLDAASYAAGVLTDAPSAYWRLGETSGTSAADSVGTNPASLHGGVTLGQAGALGDGNGAMLFNGSTGYVEAANPSVALTGDLTIELWANVSLAARQTLVSKSALNEFELTVETTGNLNFYQGDGATTQNRLSAANAVTPNVWQHIVVTRNAATNTIGFYVNGVAKGTATYTTLPAASTKPIDIGRSTAASRYTNGLIDEVALYPAALGASQIAAHYALRTADGNGTVVALPLSASDPDADALTFSATGLPAGLTVDAATGLISGTLTPASAGIHTVTATASDGTLTNDQTFTWTVTHVNRPPSLSTANQASAEGAIVNLPLAGSDPDGDVLTFSATGLPPALTLDAATGLVSGTLPFTSAGSYVVTESVSDGQVSTTHTFTWIVANTNRAPVLVNPGAQSSADQSSYAQTVQGDAASAYWRLDEIGGTAAADSVGGNAATIVGGVTLGQSGALADGNAAMLFNGSTGYLQVANPASVSLAGDLTIELWANVSLLTRQTLVSKSATNEFELTVEPSGNLHFYEGDGVTGQNFLSAAGAVTANTWQHIVVTRATATNTIGFYVNGVAKGTATYTTVPAASTKPIDIGRSTAATRYTNGLIDEVALYTSALSASQVSAHYAMRTATGTDAPVSLQLSAIDPDGDAVTYSGTGLPVGLSLDATSGLISGTLTASSAGAYTVTVNATDGSLSASQIFTWTVSNTNRAPVVTNPGAQSSTDNTSYATGVLADAPGAYWRLGEASGTSAADIAGANTATIVGGVTLGQSGALADGNTAMLLNATTGYLQAANPATLSLAGDLSIELWVNPASLATRQTLVSKSATNEFELTVETTGNLHFYQGDGVTGQNFLSAAGAVTANTWQHIVVTRSTATQTIRFYVNGAAKGTATYTIVPAASTKPIDIGRSTAATRYTNGLIDEVAVYTVALNATQIASHYALRSASGTGTPVSLAVSATDPDGDALTFSAAGLPPELTINTATGVISGTLTTASVGSYTVTVTATDGTLTTSQTFTWTVTHVGA